MQPVSFKRHRFPPDVIRLAVWRQPASRIDQRSASNVDHAKRDKLTILIGKCLLNPGQSSTPVHSPVRCEHAEDREEYLPSPTKSPLATEPIPDTGRPRPDRGTGGRVRWRSRRHRGRIADRRTRRRTIRVRGLSRATSESGMQSLTSLGPRTSRRRSI